MIWVIIIGVIILGVIISFVKDLNRDKTDLQGQSLAEKFELIVNLLNDYAFDGRGKVIPVERWGVNLYDNNSNQIIQFYYRTGHLTIKWRYKYFQKEVVYERQFNNVRNLSIFEQQKIADTMIQEMEVAIYNHKNNVLFGENRLSEINAQNETLGQKEDKYVNKRIIENKIETVTTGDLITIINNFLYKYQEITMAEFGKDYFITPLNFNIDKKKIEELPNEFIKDKEANINFQCILGKYVIRELEWGKIICRFYSDFSNLIYILYPNELSTAIAIAKEIVENIDMNDKAILDFYSKIRNDKKQKAMFERIYYIISKDIKSKNYQKVTQRRREEYKQFIVNYDEIHLQWEDVIRAKYVIIEEMQIKLTSELYSTINSIYISFEDREEARNLSYIIARDIIGLTEQETEEYMEYLYVEFVTNEKSEKMFKFLYDLIYNDIKKTYDNND